MHVIGINRSAELLHLPASPAVLAEPISGAKPPMGYSMGWHGYWTDDAEERGGLASRPIGTLWHFGTNFVFQAGIFISAIHDLVVIAASNSGSGMTRLAIRLAIDSVIESIATDSHASAPIVALATTGPDDAAALISTGNAAIKI